MSLLLSSFKVSVHDDEEDDNIVFWRLETDLLRVVLIFRIGLGILELLEVGLTLLSSWSLCKVSKVFLMHAIFLSCASEIPFNSLPSPV